MTRTSGWPPSQTPVHPVLPARSDLPETRSAAKQTKNYLLNVLRKNISTILLKTLVALWARVSQLETILFF